ncbi:MAG: response regulator [Oligoflexia bacterium]|nr:response regulator [Oligoflexia bacterium]
MKDILIVEDGKQERERLRDLFVGAGYNVVCCESVGEAEETLRYEDFRLAILDIGLNDKSGSLLFNAIRRGGKVAYIIIFTGNPSVHLKQRFMEEGAVDYIVKASAQAQNEAFLARVKEIIGESQGGVAEGIELSLFLQKYVSGKSKQLFLEGEDSFPACASCGGRSYVVTFGQQAQVPPTIQGVVVCTGCGKVMDPQVA